MNNIFERDGFFFEKRLSCADELFLILSIKGHSTLMSPQYPTTERPLSDYIDYINSHHIKNATVIFDDFEFLESCPGIERIVLFPSEEAPDSISYDAIYRMPNLKMIQPTTRYGSLERFKTIFDGSKLSSKDKIQYFSANCEYGIKNIADLKGLRTLALSGLKETSLEGVIGSDSLDLLRLVGCNKLRSLAGIEKCGAMKFLGIENCRLLSDIGSLMCLADSLDGLLIDHCPSIEDYSLIGCLKNLKRLTIGCQKGIDSISFIGKLTQLKTFTFTGNIIDGDLSFCDELENVGIYPNKRHYNRNTNGFPQRGFEEVIRGQEEIEPWRRIFC